MRTAKVVSVSMPLEVAEEFENVAKTLQRSKSDLFRDMFRIWKRFSGERERQEENSISIMVSQVLTEAEEEKRQGIVRTSEELTAEWNEVTQSKSFKRMQKRLKERGITEDRVIEGNCGDAQ